MLGANVQPDFLSLDSDLRPAIIGVEPGQVDHGVLWVAGTGKAAAIDTEAGTVAQVVDVLSASSVSVDFATQYAYVASGSDSIAIFGPFARPPLEPRIWSSEEITWNRGFATLADGPFKVMATGDLPMTLELLGELPDGINFLDNGDGTATIWGVPALTTGGAGACAALALFAFDPGTTGLFPPCPLRWATGLYCPGCGSLRAIHQLLHGNISAAFRLNPLLVITLPGILLLLCKPAWVYRPWLPRVLLVVFILYGVTRNLRFAPFTALAPG